MASGSTHCACRDCFDTAAASDMTVRELCEECREAGCNSISDYQGQSTYVGSFFGCQREDSYGVMS